MDLQEASPKRLCLIDVHPHPKLNYHKTEF